MDKMKKYWDAVYIWQLTFAPLGCMSAGIYYTYFKWKGFYAQTPWEYVIVFDSSQILYLAIAIMLMFVKEKGIVESDTCFRLIKGFVTTVLMIQYAFVMLLFPASFTWGCTFLFLVMILFLFDFKIMVGSISGYTIISVIAYLLYPDRHLSRGSGQYLESIVFRTAIFAIYSIFSAAISYFVEKFIKRVQIEAEENAFLAQQQMEYYQNLDLMDKELRKFRHDITNHFLCMQDLTEREDLSQLKQYFHDLVDDYSQNEQIFFSGNVIIDSILNYDISHLCGKQVIPVIYGKLPEIASVSSMDLCTVFSNMLSNAIKGANLLDHENELVVCFRGGDQYFSILVTNQIGADREKSARQDDRNHGHGIRNIREVTDKYQGIFEQDEEEDKFTMQVYLPI